MVLESTIVCVDNSEYMRNGDYIPNRLQAQNDAVNLICNAKTRSNPENNVGLVTLSNGRVLVTLTSEVGKILANLHQVQPHGMINFETGIRVAHLALKHRQGRNHKMRIIAFIGSPVSEGEKDLIKIAKRLKKEKVNVDVVAFGQEGENLEKLGKFVETLNGKDGSGSHLVSIPPGPALTDVLRDSPVLQGEDGAAAPGGNFEFGMDPNEDPELALALRVSMEEQRARQEAEQRQNAPAGGTSAAVPGASNAMEESSTVFANVAQEVATSGAPQASRDGEANLAAMTEEEQLAYAMQMSLRELENADGKDKPEDNAMDTDDQDTSKGSK